MYKKFPQWIFSFIFFFIVCLILIQTYRKNEEWTLSNKFILPWDEQTNILTIMPQTPFCQYFTAIDNNLSRIDVMLRKSKGKYNFTLHSMNNNETYNLLYETDFINRAQNYDFNSFNFPPVSASLGKKFSFCISSDMINPYPLGLFHARSGDNTDFQYMYGKNSKLQQGAIVFQAYSRRPISFVEFYNILSNRISQYKPWFIKIPWFWMYFIVYIIIIVVILSTICRFAINQINHNKRNNMK